METTFKEPFLNRLREALDGAVSITWEGCHKIYVCMTEAAHEQLSGYEYDLIRVEDKEQALEQLYEWFEISCGLRFIQAVSGDGTDNVDFSDLIAQFDYEKDEATNE